MCSAQPLPIELKYRTKWNSDVYGYAFLKDLHRLERMTAIGKQTMLADQRVAIFVTTESVYWEGRRPEPAPFWLTDGRRLGPRQWFQYDQDAAHTRWYQYAPFYLANEYELKWRDLGQAGRYLLVEVQPQHAR